MEDVYQFQKLEQLQSDTYEWGRLREDPVSNQPRSALLQSHALRSEECKNYMPEASKSHVQ